MRYGSQRNSGDASRSVWLLLLAFVPVPWACWRGCCQGKHRQRFRGWLLALLLATPAAALDPARRADSYSIQGWTTEDGLPSNKIRAVTQTSDGYLWVATAQGIARFDGKNFTVFAGATNPDPRGGGFWAVQKAPDDSLWFSGENGVFRWRRGSFEHFTTARGLADNHVRALAPTRDGAVVICARTGFSIVRDGRITTPGGVWKEANGAARSYLERTDGRILLGTENGLWQITGEHIARLSGTVDLPGNAFNSLCETPDGSVWIGYSGGVRRLLPGGGKEDYGVAQGLVDPRVQSLRPDRDGNLWIVTYGEGFYRLARGRIQAVTFPDRPGALTIQQVFEDREGALWVAASTGLFRVRDNMSQTIGRADGLGQTSVYSVIEARDGAWWIGLWGGGVYRYDQTEAVRLDVPPALGLDQVLSLAEEPAGTLWIGANSGLYRHRAGVTVNLYRREQATVWQTQLAQQPAMMLPGIAHPHTNSIAADGEGGLWVATDGALYHGREGSFRAFTTVNGLPGNLIKSVIRTRKGDIWITAPPAGVARLHEGRWTSYLCGRAISDVFPRAVYEDSAGAIWVTTEGGGLNRFQDGRWRTFTTRDGLADDFIAGIAEDRIGNIWITFPRGVMRIARSEFAEMDAGRRTVLRLRIFDKSDGLPAAETNQKGSPNTWLARDGRLLMATDGGVAVIEVDSLKTNPLVPPMHLERFVINGTEAVLSRPVTVPPGGNYVEIHYTALSLLAPEKVLFKIRLAPLDRDWIDNGVRREVRYDKLPPGNYTFQAIACNNDGIWNKEGVTMAFTVRPFIYQTNWFTGLMATAVAVLAFGTYRSQVRRARRERTTLEALVEERTHELRQAKEAAETTREEIARERVRFKFIFESLPVGVAWMVAGRRETRIVNPTHTRLTGVPAEHCGELERYRDITHPEDRARQDELHRRLVAREVDHYTLEKRYVRPDGSVGWTELTVRHFQDPGGDALQEIATLVDLTERKKAEGELRWKTAFLEALVDSSLLGIRVADAEGRSIFQNRRLFELWKIPAEIGERGDDAAQTQFILGQLKHPAGIVAKLIDPASRGARVDEDEIELNDGTVLERYSAPVIGKDGTHYGRISAYRDITARKQSEAELERVHRQLLDISRQAGMAEVATSVLHNIGNVLTSVNVSAGLLADQVRQSKAGGIARLGELLREHAADLAGFFARDPRGRQVPVYLDSLAAHLAAEQATMVAELDSLRKNIEHINDIVAMQQNYAKISGVVETVGVIELVEDAVRMNAAALVRHDIAFVRDFRAQPVVTVEKHKVLQILVNLLRNAKFACEESDQPDKRLTVRVTAEAGRAQVAVIDNGVGISSENLARIFSHGFTTRANGHGFGLHNGALTAKELGGSLTVRSDGPGLGATFVLELPVAPASPAP